MGYEQTLIEFLQSNLPAALVTKALGLAPVVVAIIGLIMQNVPWAAERRRWFAPLAALGLGMLAGFVAVGMDTSQTLLAIATGLLIALVAVGGHSAGKNITQSVKMSLALPSAAKNLAAAQLPTWAPGPGSNVLYQLKNGDLRPAVVVRAWSETCVNLVVTIDGSNDLEHWPMGKPARVMKRHDGLAADFPDAPLHIWATSVVKGDGPGQWRSPQLNAPE